LKREFAFTELKIDRDCQLTEDEPCEFVPESVDVLEAHALSRLSRSHKFSNSSSIFIKLIKSYSVNFQIKIV
jgi:hypothetical protein